LKLTRSGAATLTGSLSVVLWGALALLTRLTDGSIPPFQMLAMTFSLAFLLMLTKWTLFRQNPALFLRQPLRAWLVGVGGLAGYHFAYFIALANAPAVEASLIAYLWPLLIVLLSACLPGERLLAGHLLGAVLAFGGCWLLIGAGGFDGRYLTGYLAAAACAVIWACYSVASRQLRQVPVDAVGWFCGGTAALAWLAHGLLESTVWPESLTVWLGVIGLGLGPVGIAFFTWDYGVKHGNLQLLGVLSYGAPLISTLLLIVAGEGEASASVVIACAAIVGGALLAGMAHRLKRKQSTPA